MQICDIDKCTGCGACANVCSKKNIVMQSDQYGEIHPYIKEANCIDCKKCIRVCPSNNQLIFNKPSKVYASWRINSSEVKDSASGGVGAVLAENWVKQGGIVYGTKFDNSFHAVISREETLEGINAFKGSKYVQSYAGTSYAEVKELLTKGKRVLFFGTPCQLAGLLAVVGRQHPNLITVEILCHGVSSDEYLQEELRYLEKKIRNPYNNITFRTNRWMMDFYFCLWNSDKLVFSQQAYENEYFRGFLTGLTLRESCYQCSYKNIKRIGDLLIGDFIGFGKHVPFEGKNAKPSLIFCMSDKGSNLLSASSKDLVLVERTIEEALIDGRSLREPFPRHAKQKVFREIYREKGFICAMEKTIGDELVACKKSRKTAHVWRRVKLFINKMLGIKIQDGKIYYGD